MSFLRTAKILLTSVTLSLSSLAFGHPCELCSVASSLETPKNGFLSISPALQFQYDYRGTLYKDGSEINNSDKNKVATTTVNFYSGIGLAKNLILDVNVPVISREYGFGAFENRQTTRDSEIGDMSLILRGFPILSKTSDSETRFGLRGGVSLPTGDDSDLKLETQSPISSSIRGRDLSMGSGSTNLVVGSNLYWKKRRFSTYADAQYWFKTEGSENFKYGNELWLVGNTSYALLDESDDQFALGANVIYRQFAKDELRSERLSDSGSSSLFVGPAVTLDIAKTFHFKFSYNLPVYTHVNGTQVVSDYLLLGSILFAF